MNASWVVRTGRLILRPVSYADLDDLTRLKTDPRVFAVMLGGVRSPAQVTDELAEDISFWGRHGIGIWTVRESETDSSWASPACICGRTAAASRCASRWCQARRATATPARPPPRPCASAMSGPD